MKPFSNKVVLYTGLLSLLLFPSIVTSVNAESRSENSIQAIATQQDVDVQTTEFEKGFNNPENLAKGTMFRGFKIRWYLSPDHVVHIGDGQWERTINNQDDFSKNTVFTNIKEVIYQIDVSTSGSTFLNAFSPEGNAGVVIKEIRGIELLDTSKTTNFQGMFKQYSQESPLDLSTFDTRNATNMSYMFQSGKMTELNLSSFNTDKVTNMSNMFQNTVNLNSLDLTNFNTKSVTSMSNMFFNSNISSLKFSEATSPTSNGFNTTKVTNMSGMFQSIKNIDSLNLNSFDTSSVTNMSSMFYGSSITDLNINKFNTSKVTNFSSMFRLTNFKTIDLSSFNTESATTMQRMFFNTKLEELDLRTFNTDKVTDFSYFLDSSSELRSLNMDSIRTSSALNLSYMFQKLTVPFDTKNFDTSKVTNMTGMFLGTSVEKLDLSNFNTSSVTNMSYMFTNTSNLKELIFGETFNTNNVTNFEYMFSSTALEEIDASTISTPKGTLFSYMFSSPNVKRIKFGDNFSTKNTSPRIFLQGQMWHHEEDYSIQFAPSEVDKLGVFKEGWYSIGLPFGFKSVAPAFGFGNVEIGAMPIETYLFLSYNTGKYNKVNLTATVTKNTNDVNWFINNQSTDNIISVSEYEGSGSTASITIPLRFELTNNTQVGEKVASIEWVLSPSPE